MDKNKEFFLKIALTIWSLIGLGLIAYFQDYYWPIAIFFIGPSWYYLFKPSKNK